jgi:hypothetical protein
MATQINVIPSMIPALSIQPEPLFIPFLDRRKNYTPELETSRMRRAELVSDILDAQHEDVVRVLAVDVQTGTAWDATREIADDVFNELIRTGSNVQPWLVDFLEANISANELAPYLRRLAA